MRCNGPVTAPILTRRLPSPVEHRALSLAVGWGESFWWESMPASLAGSVCGVVVHEDDELVGMGRVVGDGAFYFYVQDVAVRPDRQHRGLGRVIVEDLVVQIREIAAGHCFVGLFATPQAERLYASLGWRAEGMAGMWQVLRD
jgi:GNAT superfamily N-acetyltransferase